MTKTKSFSFPTASCFQSGLFPLPHWELLCSGLPSTSPGPSKVMPSYSLPSRPHPAAAGRCRRVRTCVRSLGGCSALSPHSHLPLGSPPSSNATPPRHIFQGPTHFSSTPPAPPRPAIVCFTGFAVSLDSPWPPLGVYVENCASDSSGWGSVLVTVSCL